MTHNRPHRSPWAAIAEVFSGGFGLLFDVLRAVLFIVFFGVPVCLAASVVFVVGFALLAYVVVILSVLAGEAWLAQKAWSWLMSVICRRLGRATVVHTLPVPVVTIQAGRVEIMQ